MAGRPSAPSVCGPATPSTSRPARGLVAPDRGAGDRAVVAVGRDAERALERHRRRLAPARRAAAARAERTTGHRARSRRRRADRARAGTRAPRGASGGRTRRPRGSPARAGRPRPPGRGCRSSGRRRRPGSSRPVSCARATWPAGTISVAVIRAVGTAQLLAVRAPRGGGLAAAQRAVERPLPQIGTAQVATARRQREDRPAFAAHRCRMTPRGPDGTRPPRSMGYSLHRTRADLGRSHRRRHRRARRGAVPAAGRVRRPRLRARPVRSARSARASRSAPTPRGSCTAWVWVTRWRAWACARSPSTSAVGTMGGRCCGRRSAT